MSLRYVITADPPTPNGDLHVGHLAGPYFGANALARALRLRGHDVAYYSNFDPHQTYVVSTGLRLGLTPEQVVERFKGRIWSTLKTARMTPDLFGEPDEGQKTFVGRFFEDLYDRDRLLVKDEEIPYCGRCGHHMFETYIQGTCPHCGTPCYGNTCEVCVLPNRTVEMGSPKCRHCGEPPTEIVTYRGLFLPLSRYQEELTRFYPTRRGIWRRRLLDLIEPLLDRPLPDIPLSFVCDYGLPVSIPGFPGQVYNVRLEIVAALVHTFDVWRDSRDDGGWDWRDAPDDLSMVCFHGYENGFQYGVSFHALLLASRLGWGLPYASLSNEFYLLEGKKFSTTRDHAVWGADLLDRVDADPLRFYLALTNPEETEADFVLETFRRVADRRLVEPWNEICARVGAALGQLSEPLPAPSDGFAARLVEILGGLGGAYRVEGFSLRQAADHLAGLLDALARRSGDADGSAATRLADVLAGAALLANVAEPVMPGLAERLRGALGLSPGWPEAPVAPDPKDVRWTDDLRLRPLAEADLSGLV